MALINVSLPSDGTTADVADYNSPINTIVNEINGSLDNANIKTGAAIATAKLATDAGIVTGMIADAAITVAKRTGGFKVGTFSPSGTGSLAVTGVGFKPKLLITAVLTASASSTINYISIGAADGTSQFATAMYNEQGTDNSGDFSTSKCFLAVTTNGAVIVDGSLTSFDNDGFTLNTSTRGGSRTFGYIAIG